MTYNWLKKPRRYHLARKENGPCEYNMLNMIYKTYYPGFRRLFQALLINFFAPMLSGLFNWAKKLIPHQPFNLSSNLLGRDPSPALPGFWSPISGTKNSWSKPPWNVFSEPLRSKRVPSSFSWSMIHWPKRPERRSLDAAGIKIMPIIWPTSSDINGSFRPCCIKTFFFPFGPTSTTLKAARAVDGFIPKWLWSKGSWENFNSLSLARSISWRTLGIGPRTWPKPVVNRGII